MVTEDDSSPAEGTWVENSAATEDSLMSRESSSWILLRAGGRVMLLGAGRYMVSSVLVNTPWLWLSTVGGGGEERGRGKECKERKKEGGNRGGGRKKKEGKVQ